MSLPILTNTVTQPLLECMTSLPEQVLHRAQKADVVLGMPRHNCRFHGICRIEAYGAYNAKKPGGCKAESIPGWLLRPEPGYCILLIEKGVLLPSRERYHFDRQEIEISQPLNVTHFFAQNGEKNYFLPKGHYPLQSARGYYTMYLPLTNHTLLTNHINLNRHE